MRKAIIAVSIVFLAFGIVYAAVINGGSFVDGSMIKFAWDANVETDLAGYRIYRFDTQDGAVFGTDSPNLLADIPCNGGDTSVACTTWQTDQTPIGTWYWKITAYDLAGNESVAAENILMATVFAFDAPPLPPNNWRFEVTP